MIFLDTSALVASLSQARSRWGHLSALLERGERLGLSALALYEWRRGPRSGEEIELQRALFPDASATPLTADDALLAAELFRRLPGARSRSNDIAIAAVAIRHGAGLWTLNPGDFRDIPGLRLVEPVP
ncbi:MAG: type II toxin-antitoxin system VapC family toxin [Terriglobales bacterium]